MEESSFIECWCSSSHSYSSWMTAHVGWTTQIPSMVCSSFTTSEESGIDGHKTTSSGGTPRYEDGGQKRMHMRTRRTHNQICVKIEWSDVGRVWRMNKCVSMILNITRTWWSYWMRGRWIVSLDSAHSHMRLCSSINEECWVRLDWNLSLGMGKFLKEILESVPKIRKLHLAPRSLKL